VSRKPERPAVAAATDVLTGPSWRAAPRLTYVLLFALAGAAGLFFLIGGIFFGQGRFGFTLAGVLLVAVAVPLGWLAMETHRRYAASARLRDGGLEGTATVLGAGHSELEHRSSPLLWLDLVVHVEGRPDYRTRVREFVPASLVDRVLQGEAVPVRVDPEQPSRVVFVWPPAS
jgi:hypothetical protein